MYVTCLREVHDEDYVKDVAFNCGECAGIHWLEELYRIQFYATRARQGDESRTWYRDGLHRAYLPQFSALMFSEEEITNVLRIPLKIVPPNHHTPFLRSVTRIEQPICNTSILLCVSYT